MTKDEKVFLLVFINERRADRVMIFRDVQIAIQEMLACKQPDMVEGEVLLVGGVILDKYEAE